MPILLPFHERFRPSILEGTMTMTPRRRAYGRAGDVLATPVGRVRLVDVRRIILEDFASRYWLQAGARSPRDFADAWAELNPDRGFVPREEVWLHEFQLLSGDETA